MKLFCLLFFLVTAGVMHAQDVKNLRFEKVTGLSQNSVYSIMQDKQGFIWIATADGLNRFDGKNIVAFKPPPLSNNGAMTGSVIRSRIFEDEQEILWFSTETGLFRFDKRKGDYKMFTLLNDVNATIGISATPVFKSKGLLWLVNGDMGVISYDETKRLSKFYHLLRDDGSPKKIHQESASFYKGYIFIGGMDGLFLFDTRSCQWKKLSAATNVSCTTIFNDTLYWNEGKDIYFRSVINGIQGKIPGVDMRKETNIVSIYADANGNIYTGDDAGNICVKHANTGSFSLIANINQRPDAKPVYPALSLFVTRSGVLFAGGDVVGLKKSDLYKPFFNVYPERDYSENVNDLFVTSIAEDATGNVIAGSYQNGLHEKIKNKNNFIPLTDEIPKPTKTVDRQLPRVHSDASNNLWLCYANEIFLYPSGQSAYHKIDVLPAGLALTQSIQIYCVLQFNKGWYLGTNIGLIKIEKKKSEYKSIYISIFGQSNIKCLWYESKNRLWLGFESGGVLIVDPEKDYSMVHSFLEGAGAKSFVFDSLHALMYISTMNGLVARHIPSGEMKIFTEKDGLLNSYIYGVILGYNELWASTNRGLSNAAISFTEGQPLPLATFTNYTKKDGLPDDEFNTGAFFKGSDGTFYFGTIKGLTWFHPNKLNPKKTVPDIVFTEIIYNNPDAKSNTTAGYINKLILPYTGNEMQFKFQALEYANIEVVEYAYQMTGWDNDWVYSKQLNEVRYANLSPGTHIFKAKARKSGGAWSADKTITIIITPPFYRTYWFYTLTLIFIIGSIVFVTRNIAQRKLKTKIEDLERQKVLYQERLRISREMHDDIGAGLTQIVLMSESARNITGISGKKELTEITDASRQLVNNMGEIIWSMNPGNTTLEHIMAHLREQLHKQLEYAGMQYILQLPENGKEIIFSNEKRRNILLITREIVNNAIKHSKAKNISVIAVITNNRLTFYVTDDGTGFDPEQVKNGNGLKNIRHRITEMGGEITFEPLKKGGLRLTYSIPVNPTT